MFNQTAISSLWQAYCTGRCRYLGVIVAPVKKPKPGLALIFGKIPYTEHVELDAEGR